MFAAWNAAPNAIASSPFKCVPISTSVSKYSAMVYWTLGTLTPPPINSTTLTSFLVRFACFRTFSIGGIIYSRRLLTDSSNSSRFKNVVKSFPSETPSMNT